MADDPLDQLSHDEKQALAALVQEDSTLNLSRRDALALMGGASLGAVVAGSSGDVIGSAKADASTSDSDGNVGLPNDRVDVFADGFDAETQLTLPQYSSDSNAPQDCFFFNTTDSKAKYKDGSGTVYTAFTNASTPLTDSGTDTADGGNIYVLPNVEDALDLQSGGEIQNADAIDTQDLTVSNDGSGSGLDADQIDGYDVQKNGTDGSGIINFKT